jgi:D-tyrosyl-tRNA(Tyr) deacylase
VSRAAVNVDGAEAAAIGPGLLVLVAVAPGDTGADARAMAAKVAMLRVLADDEGKMNRSLLDQGGEVLVVSQFTLYADTRRGNRPSFSAAAPPAAAAPLIDEMVAALRDLGARTKTGVFGARMSIELVNDGPVTLIVEVPPGR